MSFIARNYWLPIEKADCITLQYTKENVFSCNDLGEEYRYVNNVQSSTLIVKDLQYLGIFTDTQACKKCQTTATRKQTNYS